MGAELNIITLAEVGSTSTYLREALVDAPHGTVVRAVAQTAGRGQRGNSWEAEPGKNLTFSILLRPGGIKAIEQYAISEAVAVAVTDVIRECVENVVSAEDVKIKWPNDIYYKDMKICGILIENTLLGSNIERSIAGIGINVNQVIFRSDAPNPVSLVNITHRGEYNLEDMLISLTRKILSRVEEIFSNEGRIKVAQRYHELLWRRDGYYPYRLPDGEHFNARIERVAPTGHITLEHTDGTSTTHAFKEVFSVL